MTGMCPDPPLQIPTTDHSENGEGVVIGSAGAETSCPQNPTAPLALLGKPLRRVDPTEARHVRLLVRPVGNGSAARRLIAGPNGNDHRRNRIRRVLGALCQRAIGRTRKRKYAQERPRHAHCHALNPSERKSGPSLCEQMQANHSNENLAEGR